MGHYTPSLARRQLECIKLTYFNHFQSKSGWKITAITLCLCHNSIRQALLWIETRRIGTFLIKASQNSRQVLNAYREGSSVALKGRHHRKTENEGKNKHQKLKFSTKNSKKNNTLEQTLISTWFALHFRLGCVWVSSRRSRAPSKKWPMKWLQPLQRK